MKYGARHLKRAIERTLVHPLSNLIASDQVRGGDLVQVDFDADLGALVFTREAEDMPVYAMVQMIEDTSTSSITAAASRGARPYSKHPG